MLILASPEYAQIITNALSGFVKLNKIMAETLGQQPEPVKAPETFKDRLVKEENELGLKLEKLEVFLLGEKIKELPNIQQFLLKSQAAVMRAYDLILTERIKLLS